MPTRGWAAPPKPKRKPLVAHASSLAAFESPAGTSCALSDSCLHLHLIGPSGRLPPPPHVPQIFPRHVLTHMAEEGGILCPLLPSSTTWEALHSELGPPGGGISGSGISGNGISGNGISGSGQAAPVKVGDVSRLATSHPEVRQGGS